MSNETAGQTVFGADQFGGVASQPNHISVPNTAHLQ